MKDKLHLSCEEYKIIEKALWEYKANGNRPLTDEELDEVNELRLRVDLESSRLFDIKRRKENGLFLYVFYDADNNELGEFELHNDGEAWEHLYKTFAQFYPTGLHFEKIEDSESSSEENKAEFLDFLQKRCDQIENQINNFNGQHIDFTMQAISDYVKSISDSINTELNK